MRRRLDVEMVRRGLATSRSEAALAIRSGSVSVQGRPAVKASTLVLPHESITISGPVRPFVSRGGEKLEAALDRFRIDVSDRSALDAGASSGGFTDCLLSRGAALVIAVDVGYGQLDWRLRNDERVIVLERTNARDLAPDALPFAPEVVTGDLSFISLRLAIPALVRCSSPRAEFVLLVKPQFEARAKEVEAGGVVSDLSVWRRVLSEVATALTAEGVGAVGVMASPLLGPAGNAEFFLYGRRPGELGSSPAERNGSLDVAVESAVDEASRLIHRR
ncbi:MAG: TlyA family RNA methyltransferase [Actinomycetota bacterium]